MIYLVFKGRNVHVAAHRSNMSYSFAKRILTNFKVFCLQSNKDFKLRDKSTKVFIRSLRSRTDTLQIIRMFDHSLDSCQQFNKKKWNKKRTGPIFLVTKVEREGMCKESADEPVGLPWHLTQDKKIDGKKEEAPR